MVSDMVGAGDRWIPDDEYQNIIRRVPIVCVDVLLRRQDSTMRVGLIHRDTYDGGTGWCLVGGAVLKDEPLVAAVQRHVRATLGAQIDVNLSSLTLSTVAEYFTRPDIGDLYDPRKHAVALTYTALCSGEAAPTGEADEFRWFDVDYLPKVEFGFEQGIVVSKVVAGLDLPG